jgi:hypothetical protein
MARNAKERRYDERWVDCSAAQAAYDQTKAYTDRFFKLRELGPGLLSRIRGRGKAGVRESYVLIQYQNVRNFAECCGVETSTLLTNGDGRDRPDTSEPSQYFAHGPNFAAPTPLTPYLILQSHETVVRVARELIANGHSVADLIFSTDSRPTKTNRDVITNRLNAIDTYTILIAFHSAYELLEYFLLSGREFVSTAYLSNIKSLLSRIYGSAALACDALLDFTESKNKKSIGIDLDSILDATWVDMSAVCSVCSVLMEHPMLAEIKTFDPRLNEKVFRSAYEEVKSLSNPSAR